MSGQGLTGYTLPLSPTGGASMVTPPPWHFSGDLLWIDYEADAEAVAAFIPPELEKDAEGRAAAVFAEWQWCSDTRDELGDPARCRFSEFFILLSCTYCSRPVARCPFAWVDHTVSLVRGWIQGMPKQFGVVRMTRPIRAGRAGSRLEAGGTFSATLSVHDRLVVESNITLTGLASEPPDLNGRPLVHSRVFPAWTPDQESLNELVVSRVMDVEYSPVWSGVGDLRFVAGSHPELERLLPIGLGPAYAFSYAETLLGGKRLHDADF